jgi:hypothetical protein
MKRLSAWLIVALLVISTAPTVAVAQTDEEPNLEFFYPLVTRRPVIEREVEFRVNHFKGVSGRETDVVGALEGPILPRWQVEIELPLVFLQPQAGVAMGGVGDLTLENKILLFKSVEHRAQVAAGFETRFPTGSEKRGLGGEAAIEPFLTAGIAPGAFDLIGEVAYEANINAHVKGPQEQQLTGAAAAAYRWTRWVAPLLELRTTTRTRGADERENVRLLHRTVVSLIPGINLRPFARSTLGLGLELPVTEAKTFDYAIRMRFIREF